MAAEVLATGGAAVTVHDRMASPGRKLLLAGRGGLNLTHGETEDRLLVRYGAAETFLRPALAAFGQQALRAWCADLGIETFVGSSGRVFPVSFKTSPLLRAWLRRLDSQGVRFALNHRWLGFDDAGGSRVSTAAGDATIRADATVLALGGASWPQLGSDGGWVEALDDVAPLRPANCGFAVPWSDYFRDAFEGAPLKSVSVSVRGTRPEDARGDLVVTRAGLEGGAIYAVAPALREAIDAGHGTMHIGLRPDLSHDVLVAKLARRGAKDSLSNALRKTLGLAPVAIGLMREAAGTELTGMDAPALARLVAAVPIRATAAMPIARAISTAGGVRFEGLDAGLMLRARPGVFVAGEMLDWEAPTGGYLLQACFATGALAGASALRHLHAEAETVERGG